jgi:hypothetical protein
MPLPPAHFRPRPIAARIIANLLGVPKFLIGQKKPAVQNRRARNVKGKLEPEYASNIKTAAGSQIRSWNGVTGELWKRKCVSKGVRTGILDERIDGCEVRVVESIQRSKAELERCPLVELDLLGHARIEEVKRSIASDIAWRIAERCSKNGLGDTGVSNVPHLADDICNYGARRMEIAMCSK